MNLEIWAFEVIREGNISEADFAAELPRIGVLLESVKPNVLKNMLVNLTLKGMPFKDALDDIEQINEILFRVVIDGQETFATLGRNLRWS